MKLIQASILILLFFASFQAQSANTVFSSTGSSAQYSDIFSLPESADGISVGCNVTAVTDTDISIELSNNGVNFTEAVSIDNISSTGYQLLEKSTYVGFARIKLEPNSGSFTADCVVNWK